MERARFMFAECLYVWFSVPARPQIKYNVLEPN